MKTWHFESLFVAIFLTAITYLTKNSFTEYIGCAAVWLTFNHASVSDRMAERQALKTKPDVDCYRMSLVYFIGKELLWLAYFLKTGSYSALCGVILFLVYPFWRKFWRKYHPLKG
jgi:hypothetical protein